MGCIRSPPDRRRPSPQPSPRGRGSQISEFEDRIARSRGRPGRPDFEASTKVVHGAARPTGPARTPVASVAGPVGLAAEEQRPWGSKRAGKINPGGTPEQAGLGPRPGLPRDRGATPTHINEGSGHLQLREARTDQRGDLRPSLDQPDHRHQSRRSLRPSDRTQRHAQQGEQRGRLARARLQPPEDLADDPRLGPPPSVDVQQNARPERRRASGSTPPPALASSSATNDKRMSSYGDSRSFRQISTSSRDPGLRPEPAPTLEPGVGVAAIEELQDHRPLEAGRRGHDPPEPPEHLRAERLAFGFDQREDFA